MTKLEAGLGVAVLVAGWFIWAEHADRIRAEAAQEPLRMEAAEARQRAQERDDSLRAVRGRAQEMEAALEAATRVAVALSDSLARVVTVIEVQVDVAGGELTALLEEMREHLPEPARALVDSAQVRVAELTAANRTTAEAFRQQTASFAAFRAQSDGALGGMRARAEAAEASALEWQATASAEAARADNAEQLATRGVLDRIKGSLPFLSLEGTIAGLVGAGIGVVATR